MRPSRAVALLLGVVVPVLVLYVLTAPRTVLLEDDGLFLLSTSTLGISHPPGYPVYTLLGWLAAQVPIGSVALRVHLLSGVAGALAAGLLAWITLRRTGHAIAALAAGLALGVSEHVWSQAIIADVYSLNLLLFFAILALCVEAAASPSAGALAGASALYGLSLANHWPLTVLATPAFVFTLACRWRDVVRRLPLIAGTVLACAAAPYAWMVWRSNQDPVISFYGPIDSWRDVVFYVSRRGYRGVDVSPTAGWSDKLGFATYFLREAARALTPLGAVVAVAGVWRQWRAGWGVATVGEAAAFVASSLLLAFVLGFDLDFLRVAVFRPYPLVAYGLLALWMGSGLAGLLTLARARGRWAPLGVATVALLLPVFLVWQHWPANSRARDDFAARHATLLLRLLEPGGVLLVYGDSDTGPVGYLHVVEGRRPDVALYNLQGLVFRDRLLPALSGTRERERRLRAFLERDPRPAYHMTDKVVPPVFAEDHLGFLKRIDRSRGPGVPRAQYRPEAEAFFRDLLAMPVPVDRWVRLTRNQLLHQYGSFLALAQLGDDAGLRDRVAPLVALARGDYYALTGMAEMLTQYAPDRAAWERAVGYLDLAATLRDDSLDRERLAREHYLRGFLAFRLGDVPGSEQWFRRSLEVHPHPDNAASLALRQLEDAGRQRK